MCVRLDGHTEQNMIRRRDIPKKKRLFFKKKKELEKGH